MNYGFPNCYTQYAWGGIPGVPVGSGCVQPVVAFQPVTDAGGIHQLIGATQVALAPSDFPDGFNDGVFVGFTGDGGEDNNGGMAYYDFATGIYTQFIESTDVDNIIGLSSTDSALFFTDAGTGNVYELTAASASPEPGTGLAAALATRDCGMLDEAPRVAISPLIVLAVLCLHFGAFISDRGIISVRYSSLVLSGKDESVGSACFS